ncbi:MAG TPA: hypothetical protein DCY20_08970 [Firmicutes bacterium]|nr:hypothetical protein [Bacillota bacterium]
MKTLKLMMKSIYSMDAVYALRKAPILATIAMGILLSMFMMTPFAYSFLNDDTYRWDEKIWMITDEEKAEIVEMLPECEITDYKLSCQDSAKVVTENDITVGVNVDPNTITNGVTFNQDELVFVEQGRQYSMNYAYYEGVNFTEIKSVDTLEGYEMLFKPFGQSLKPLMIVPLLFGNYQTGILTYFIYVVVISAISMMLKFGHVNFISYKEMVSIMIYASALPITIALIFGIFITPAFTTLIFNFGTPLFAYAIYKRKVMPNLV